MKPISFAVASIVGWLQGATLLAVKVPLRQEKVIDRAFDDIRAVLDGAVENSASNERLASLDRLTSALVSLSGQSPPNRETIKTRARQIVANIGSTVKPSFLRRHGEVNRTVSRALEKTATCDETFSLGVEAANSVRDTLPSQKAALQRCQQSVMPSAENTTSLLRASAQQSANVCDELEKITSLMSSHVHDWGSQCDKRDDVDVGAYLKKQATYWDGVLDQYDALDKLCQQSKEESPAVELSRAKSSNPDRGHVTEDDCGLLQMRMDSDSCTQALDRMQVCAAHDDCSSMWSGDIQKQCAEEGRFTQAWSFLEHATCMLRSFVDERGDEDLERRISECKQQPQGSSASVLLELPSCRMQEVPIHSSEIADCSALWFPGADPNISGTGNYVGVYYQGLTPERCNSSCCLNPPQPQRPSAVLLSVAAAASVGKRCISPLTGAAYNYTDLQENDLQMGSSFSVSAKCASGYTGTAKAVKCSHDGDPYNLVGCVGELCVAPLDTTGYVLTDISTERPSFNVNAKCAIGFTGNATVQECSGDLLDYVLQGCHMPAPLSALALQTSRSSKCFRKECGCPGASHDFPDSLSWCSMLSTIEKWEKNTQMETACGASSDACNRCNGLMCMSQAESVKSISPNTGVIDTLAPPEIAIFVGPPSVGEERNAKQCSSPQPETFFNYTDVQELDLGLGSNFNVLAKCAPGYTGTAMAMGCSKSGEVYQIVGCTGEICTAPRDSTAYVLTEINTERPSFNVLASCADGYDGIPSVKECPGDLQEYEISGCQATTISASLEKVVNSNASAGDVYNNLCFHRDCGCPGKLEDFPESDGWCKMLNTSAKWDWHTQMETACGTSADSCNLCDGTWCRSRRSMQMDEVATLLTNLVHRSPITSPSAFCFNSVCGCPGQLGTFPNSSDLCRQGTNMSKYRYHKPGWCEESVLNCRLCHGSWCPTVSNATSR